MEGDALAKLSYPSMIDSEPRARFELAPARYNVAALPAELSRHGLGGGPRSRTTGLEGQYAAYYATPSCSRSGRHDWNVHEPSATRPLFFFEAAAATVSPRPGNAEPSARVERAASHLPGERSACAELRRLGAGGRIRTCSALKRVTFWAWCVYLFRHPGKGSPVSDSNRRSPL